MRVAYLTDIGALELRDVEDPSPGPGEVVIDIRAALTCGTDLKAFQRGHPRMPFPTLLGHEFAGVVSAAGPGASFTPGTPLMAVHTAPCTKCDLCRRGRENLCPEAMSNKVLGGYADRLLLPAPVVSHNAYAKPDALEWGEAALLEPLSCVLHGLSCVDIPRGGTVAIIGAGAIAQMMMLVVRRRGAGRVIVAARRPWRAERAREAGADVVIDATGDDAAGALVEATDGGADLLIECVGTPPTWQLALGAARRGATVLAFGGCARGTQVTVDTHQLHYEEVALVGAFHFTPRAVQEARELLIDGLAREAPLITGRMPLAEIGEAFALLGRGQALKLELNP